MKYGVQYGIGDYIYKEQRVAVVEFGTGSACRSWVRELPSKREEISGKCYVTSTDSQRQVHVKRAAISPDFAEAESPNSRRVPLEFDADSRAAVSKPKRFGS